MSDAPPPVPRRCRRSISDWMIAGVCGGLAAHLGIDPLIPRVAFVLFALGGGGGVLLYVVMWILMPQEEL